MMRCDQSQRIIENWDIRGDHLSEAVVMHMDDCSVCLGLFDGRFQPLDLEEGVEVPEGLIHRVLPVEPPDRSAWAWPVAMALAALFVGGISVRGLAPQSIEMTVQRTDDANVLAMGYLDEVEQLVALGEYDAALKLLAKAATFSELDADVVLRMNILKKDVEVALLVGKTAPSAEREESVDSRSLSVRPRPPQVSSREWVTSFASSKELKALAPAESSVSDRVDSFELIEVKPTLITEEPNVVKTAIVPFKLLAAKLPVEEQIRLFREIPIGFDVITEQLVQAGFSEFDGVFKALSAELMSDFKPGEGVRIYPRGTFYFVAERLNVGQSVSLIASALRKAHHQGALRTAGAEAIQISQAITRLPKQLSAYGKREIRGIFEGIEANLISSGLAKRDVNRTVLPLKRYWISNEGRAVLFTRQIGRTIVDGLEKNLNPDDIGRSLRREAMLQRSQSSGRREAVLTMSALLRPHQQLQAKAKVEELIVQTENNLIAVGFSEEQVIGLFRQYKQLLLYGVSSKKTVSVSPKELFDFVADRYLIDVSRAQVLADLAHAIRNGALE